MSGGRETLKFPPSARADVVHLLTLADRLADIQSHVDNLTGVTDIKEAATTIGRQTGIPAADIQRVLWTILNLHRLMARLGVDSRQLMESIEAALEPVQSEGPSQGLLGNWEECSQSLAAFLDSVGPDHPLILIRKAESLATSHQNILTESRIVTDLRPVFDSLGERVLQWIVTHTLFIEYYDGGESRHISFGLDNSDLRELRRVCERAELKSSTLKATVGDALPTRIIGEQESEVE